LFPFCVGQVRGVPRGHRSGKWAARESAGLASSSPPRFHTTAPGASSRFYCAPTTACPSNTLRSSFLGSLPGPCRTPVANGNGYSRDATRNVHRNPASV
jgi:hypothetical protein